MIKTSYLALILFILSVQTGTAAAQSVRFFRHVQYDRKHHFAFRGEIFGKDTLRVKHYRATYDKKGRLTKWEYFRSAGMKSNDDAFGLAVVKVGHEGQNITYHFFDQRGLPAEASQPFTGEGHNSETLVYGKDQRDSIGPYMEIILYDRSGMRIEKNRSNASSYRCYLDPKGIIIRKQFLDIHGDLVLGKDGSCDLHYQNDERGNMSDLIGYDLEGRENWRDHYTNDSNGRFLEINPLDPQGKPDPDRTISRYRYDKNGYTILNGDYRSDGSLVKLWTYENDDFGNLIIEREYDEDKNLVEQTERFFDERNLFLGTIKSNEEEGAYMRDSMVYDSKGRMTEVYWLEMGDASEALVNDTRKIATVYHDDWRDIENFYYDKSGKFTENEHGASRQRWVYDDWGDIDRVFFMDAYGAPVNSSLHGCAVIKYLRKPGGFSYIDGCTDKTGRAAQYRARD